MPRARLPRTEFLCHYCGVRPGVTTDHIVPRAFGGPDAIWNFVPSCPTCNSQKASNWPTHDCPVCQNAIARFLADPAKREKALEILGARAEDLESGKQSHVKQLQKLGRQQRELNDLYASIATWGEDPDAA